MVRAVSRLICSCWGFKRGASPKPPRHLRRGDDDQFGRRPSQANVEELVETVAVDRELDEDDDLALHALEAADRFEQNVIRLVWDVLWRETVDLRLRGHTHRIAVRASCDWPAVDTLLSRAASARTSIVSCGTDPSPSPSEALPPQTRLPARQASQTHDHRPGASRGSLRTLGSGMGQRPT